MLIKKNFPFISICIPVFQSEKYLSRCLESVFSQNYQDFEVIVVNDNSNGFDDYGNNFAKIIKSIEKRGQPSSKLIFWPQYAETFYKPIPKEYINISEIPENDNFKIVFAGNIGQAQGLDILVTVAKQIKQKKDKVEFYLIKKPARKDWFFV